MVRCAGLEVQRLQLNVLLPVLQIQRLSVSVVDVPLEKLPLRI